MKFEVFTGANDEFYFRLKDGDAVVLRSEGYTSKAACTNGLESVKKNAGNKDRYDVKEAANGKWHFNLKAGNGQVIGTSLLFEKNDLESVIEKLAASAADASVEEV